MGKVFSSPSSKDYDDSNGSSGVLLGVATVGVVGAGLAYYVLFRRNEEENQIPWAEPSPNPIFGHMLTMKKHADKPGGVFAFIKEALKNTEDNLARLKIPGREPMVLCGNADILLEIMKNQKDSFGKNPLEVTPVFGVLREFVPNGLFTANDDDPYWSIAHRILSKPFSAGSVKNFLPIINEQGNLMVSQLIKNVGYGNGFELSTWTTKMAFESIAVCGFSKSFESLERSEPHEFVEAMEGTLRTTRKKANTPPSLLKLTNDGRKVMSMFTSSVDKMNSIVARVIEDRISGLSKTLDPENPDFLDIMLNERDTVTKRKLTKDVIRQELITFLVAGHDSTSSAIANVLHFLFLHPDKGAKVYEEILKVVGPQGNDVEWQHLVKMKYLSACMNESLRLRPPAPGFVRIAQEDVTLLKYKVKKGTPFLVNLGRVHEDEKFWGADALQYRPERWIDEPRPSNPCSFLPFATGERGCIGKQFSLIEQKVAVVKLLQHFYLRIQDSDFKMHDQLFLKPVGLETFIYPRTQNDVPSKRPDEVNGTSSANLKFVLEGNVNHGNSMHVVYGSNGGSTKKIAKGFAEQATGCGFKVTFSSLDEAVSLLTKKEEALVVIFAATYNGEPADNAREFIKLAKESKSLESLKFCLFGCGNTAWADSYQDFPKLLHQTLQAKGALSLCERGEGDSDGELFGFVQSWCSQHAWPKIGRACGVVVRTVEDNNEAKVYEEVAKQKESVVTNKSRVSIIENKELQAKAKSGRSTKHIYFQLPESKTYNAGDHLCVLPQNNPGLVRAYLEHLGYNEDTMVRYDGGLVLKVQTILSSYVDLSAPLKSSSIYFLKKKCKASLGTKFLSSIAQDSKLKVTLLEVLKITSMKLSLGEILKVLPELKGRYYSISSSPLTCANKASITVALASHETGSGDVAFGTCSGYLNQVKVSSNVVAYVKRAPISFRLPLDVSTPIILVGPGTGVAPLRGFIHERYQQRTKGQNVGEILFFFGCRNEHDNIYKAEFDEIETKAPGLFRARFVAFSRLPQRPKTYVQDLIKANSGLVRELLDNKAEVYVCGDAKHMAPAVSKAFNAIVPNLSSSSKYHQDVWGGNA